MTQAGLSSASGVPVGTIRDYEQVKRDPLLSTAVKLAAALRVSVAVFAECQDREEGKGRRKDAKHTPKAKKARGGPRKEA
jgi:transcriptional regulator with XRE-family HTH domain